MPNQRPILHVRLFNAISRFDANQLCHYTIHQVGIILTFIGFTIRQKPQFHQFSIAHIIKSVQISPCFLNRIAVRLQRIGICPRKQPPTSVSQTLMQIGMEIVANIAISLYHVQRRVVNDKLFQHSRIFRSLMIRLCQIENANTFRTMRGPNPLGIGQINADSRSGILVSAQHGRTDDIGYYTLDLFLTEASVYR